MQKLKAGLLSVIFGYLLLTGAVAWAATPDGETPENEGVCDQLIGGTPGLYGLCVAFCESQDCQATYDPATGLLEMDASCKASDPVLLQKYNKRRVPGDPDMPCVKTAATNCQCWSAEELYGLASFQTANCGEVAPSNWVLRGTTLARWKTEFAQATSTQCMFYGADENGNLVNRYQALGEEEASICISSLRTECTYRGF